MLLVIDIAKAPSQEVGALCFEKSSFGHMKFGNSQFGRKRSFGMALLGHRIQHILQAHLQVILQ
jgi:hypothetical protein